MDGGIRFLTVSSMPELLEALKCQEENDSVRACVYVIRSNVSGEEAERKEVIRILKNAKWLTLFVIDTLIDISFLDCMISADLCMATEYGGFCPESSYEPSNLYSKEQIYFLLGKSCNQQLSADELFREGSLIHMVISREQMRDTIESYLSSMLFARSQKHLSYLKQYFNLFKTELWEQKEKTAQKESQIFCFLARNQEEAHEL